MDRRIGVSGTLTDGRPAILFFTKTYILSNFYPAGFILSVDWARTKGSWFSSSEQAYQAHKAATFGDWELVDKILGERDPGVIKRLAGNVRNYVEGVWKERKLDVMRKVVFEKFAQNMDLKQLLLSTGNATLAEASPSDLFWGTGVHFRDQKAFNPRHWIGENMLGQVLHEVRDQLRSGLSVNGLKMQILFGSKKK